MNRGCAANESHTDAKGGDSQCRRVKGQGAEESEKVPFRNLGDGMKNPSTVMGRPHGVLFATKKRPLSVYLDNGWLCCLSCELLPGEIPGVF